MKWSFKLSDVSCSETGSEASEASVDRWLEDVIGGEKHVFIPSEPL